MPPPEPRTLFDKVWDAHVVQAETDDAPAILYGCGDPRLLEGGGLAVVGSRRKGDQPIVAREITKGQLSLILRDKKGIPNWLPR